MLEPSVPVLDIEKYTRHLGVNTNRHYDSLSKAGECTHRDMKLPTWNIQGAQGTVSLQRSGNVLPLIQQCRIDLCGMPEYNPGFSLLEAATTTLNNNYNCYAAPSIEPRVAFLVRNVLVPHIIETRYSPPMGQLDPSTSSSLMDLDAPKPVSTANSADTTSKR